MGITWKSNKEYLYCCTHAENIRLSMAGNTKHHTDYAYPKYTWNHSKWSAETAFNLFPFSIFFSGKKRSKRFFSLHRIWDFNSKRRVSARIHVHHIYLCIDWKCMEWISFYRRSIVCVWTLYTYFSPHKKSLIYPNNESHETTRTKWIFGIVSVTANVCSLHTQSYHFRVCTRFRFRFRSFARLVLTVIVVGWQILSVY